MQNHQLLLIFTNEYLDIIINSDKYSRERLPKNVFDNDLIKDGAYISYIIKKKLGEDYKNIDAVSVLFNVTKIYYHPIESEMSGAELERYIFHNYEDSSDIDEKMKKIIISTSQNSHQFIAIDKRYMDSVQSLAKYLDRSIEFVGERAFSLFLAIKNERLEDETYYILDSELSSISLYCVKEGVIVNKTRKNLETAHLLKDDTYGKIGLDIIDGANDDVDQLINLNSYIGEYSKILKQFKKISETGGLKADIYVCGNALNSKLLRSKLDSEIGVFLEIDSAFIIEKTLKLDKVSGFDKSIEGQIAVVERSFTKKYLIVPALIILFVFTISIFCNFRAKSVENELTALKTRMDLMLKEHESKENEDAKRILAERKRDFDEVTLKHFIVLNKLSSAGNALNLNSFEIANNDFEAKGEIKDIKKFNDLIESFETDGDLYDIKVKTEQGRNWFIIRSGGDGHGEL